MIKNNIPLVSVVVATKNEEKNIKRCLESIKKQSIPQSKLEIIVIDNSSTDKTRSIAKELTSKVYNLIDERAIKNVKNLRGAQLNFGVSKSRGEIIFFPDADMTFDKLLLKEALDLLKQDKIEALYIPEVVLGKGFFGKIRSFERSFYETTPIDAVRIVTRKLFSDVGGFDEKNIRFGPDDWDFTKRIKAKTAHIRITKSRLYHHEEDMTLLTYLTKKKNYTNTFSEYTSKWKKDPTDLDKQLGIKYRFFDVFIENGKWKKLIKNPLLTFGMYALKFAVGIPYLYYKLFKK